MRTADTSAMAQNHVLSAQEVNSNMKIRTPQQPLEWHCIARSILLATLSFGLLATSASAISISLVPSSADVAVGESLFVDIMIEDLGTASAPSLGVFDIDIMFSESTIGVTGVTFGSQLDILGFGSIASSGPNGTDRYNIFELSLDPADVLDSLQLDSFVLATLEFEALAVGIVPIGLDVITLGDSYGAPLTATTSGATIRVSEAIPEPRAGLLFGIGMLVASGSFRRRGRGCSATHGLCRADSQVPPIVGGSVS